MASVYIHIPFCESRCIYCDFYSTTQSAQKGRYVDCLIREMEQRRDEWQDASRAQTSSIYIGGGTPSTLSPTLLSRILEAVTRIYPPMPDAEITVEANPDDVTDEWVEALTHTPVNRISMGVQTFDDNRLKLLHRRHTAAQAQEAVQRLKAAGYHNISIDLIYGLPGQTLADWEQDVAKAIALQVPHLSAYSLMYEEGTALMRLLDEGKVSEMDEDESWRCYELLCQCLEQAGYAHYEISNFALPGWHSRHNSGYWDGTRYMGFGAGAHSYDGMNKRRCNLPSLDDYMTALENTGTSATGSHPYFEIEELSITDLYNEFVMTRLRTAKGLALDEVLQRFGNDLYQYCINTAKPHLQRGNLLQTGSVLSLSRKGIFVSNDIISDLFYNV